MVRKLCVSFIMCFLLFWCVGCGMNEEKIEAAAQEVVTTISDGNMEEVNRLIFHTNELTVDKELISLENNDSQKQGQGIFEVLY